MALFRFLLLSIAAWAPLQQVARADEVQATDAPAAEDRQQADKHAEEPLWEWSGVFELEAGGAYTWSAARGEDGAYADAGMRLVVVALPAGAEAVAEAEGLCEVAAPVTSGDTLALSGGTCYRLVFDERSWVSLFRLRPAVSGRYAFFTEHLPWEFENGFHFLKDERGADVEAEPASAVSGVGLAVGGAALSALPGLVMIALVGPSIARVSPAVFSVLNSFASGVIFAAAVFLLLPEALHLAGEGQAESVAAAAWGSAVMCGWLVGVLSHYFARQVQGNVQVEKDGEVEQEAATHGAAPRSRWSCARLSATDRPIDLTVTLAVLLGDIWHNFVDGVVIGFSAKMCTSAAFWGVVGATLAHEAPQEVADFIVLLSEGGLHWGWATFLNSMSAFPSTVLGALIAHQAAISSNWQGVLLAFGAGVYLFVAATELAPSLMRLSGSAARASAARLLAFAAGAACIGLVLIDHTHCSPVGGPADAGHAH